MLAWLEAKVLGHCLAPGNLKERNFPQDIGDKGREVTQCRMGKAGLGPKEPCYSLPTCLGCKHTQGTERESLIFLVAHGRDQFRACSV